ncbi:RmlC-like cupin domain-containing protein [Diaporthe sp. PMI_573]|nr:RmlC-like cupin domain-containing protein [Diaporthaceae sp. PMI_573]
MWMGTYPTTPSYILSSGEDLQQYLNAHQQDLIGEKVLAKYGADLSFLPKILSIAKALPLQLHPNKELASKLHREQPGKFSDSNHKPEIAVAVSDFELFVGFKPLDIISDIFQLEGLQRFLPNHGSSKGIDDSALRHICVSMLRASESVVQEVQRDLLRLPKESLGQHVYIQDLLPRLQEQYTSADNGTLVALLCMNYMKLKKGEAVYVPQDSIHAYLSGDIVECMARSDNVLSTGFCPRADRDSVDLFVETLTFTPHRPEAALLNADRSAKGSGKSWEYAPPAAEFNILATVLTEGEQETLKPIFGPSIAIVVEGSGAMSVDRESVELKKGYVFFIGQGVQTELKANNGNGLTVYRAYAEADRE